ncbi:hypothetical protein SDC9_115678 [bioreactor metagenome]|uniref:OB domain-containing protein n=1 Tax=bioreactor metagenome TaxID=1076179 RepID=A0A645C463_9ZZZZ
MAFATLEDSTGKAEVVIFPKAYESVAGQLQEDSVILARAKVEHSDEEFKLIAERISIPETEELAFTASQDYKEIFVPRKTTPETLKKLGNLLKANHGKEKMVIVIPNGGKPERITLPYTVNWNEALQQQVETLLN